ncbi:MAG: hypothetical protein E7005_08025 [Alphaproteobacteria bacterium]|nr:hypothetical protein [Alphaproteobacteria bacterium]
MNKLFNWMKKANNDKKYIKPQRFVEVKRSGSVVNFITPGHPLYDNIVSKEENVVRLFAPNQTAYNEKSTIHNFVATVVYNEQSYLLINTLKHFKEQTIGGVLQYDETIYNVIPFFETDEEYQTASDYMFSEIFEYDHPVQSYALRYTSKKHDGKITLDKGKSPVSIKMIDEKRELFSNKLSKDEIEMIDYVIMPAIEAFDKLLETKKDIFNS